MIQMVACEVGSLVSMVVVWMDDRWAPIIRRGIDFDGGGEGIGFRSALLEDGDEDGR